MCAANRTRDLSAAARGTLREGGNPRSQSLDPGFLSRMGDRSSIQHLATSIGRVGGALPLRREHGDAPVTERSEGKIELGGWRRDSDGPVSCLESVG